MSCKDGYKSMNETAIKVENLSKMYRLGTINNGTLWKDIQTWAALKRGKEDPHSKIGQDKYSGDADHFWALKDLNFDIKQGDRIGIIGKNGAGKSTLLKLLSRVTSPTEGTIKIKGKIASLLEVGTGFNGELTGRENIYLNGAILGMKKKQIDRKLAEIIDFSGIEHHIDTPVKRYSSGMYVRLAFAVAAHLDSEILIADEVLAVGDADFQKKALGKMQDLSTGQGRTVLFVSHNMGAVQALCNKGLLMEEGRVILQDSIVNCIERYLSAKDGKISSGCWKGSEGDATLQMNRVFISPDANEEHARTAYKKGERMYLHIDYSVAIPDSNFVFSVEFFNNSGIQLCVNSASDFFDAERLKKLSAAGSHSLTLEIDTTIFANGRYRIFFDFAIHNVKRIVTDTPSLYFEVFSGTGNIGQSTGARTNIIYPDWKWKDDGR